jgi:anti-sigma regulatory factor (Ser/Thr protein kinase)/anti-anti-sigma regulatory factor
MRDDLVIRVGEALGHVVLRLSGQLSLRTAPRVREATVKSLLSTGHVVIDLSGLHTTQAAFVTVFPAALEAAGGWPSATLVLCGADAGLRSMLIAARITETVPLAADLASARAILRQRPPEVRRHRDLPLHNSAALAARLFVRETCEAWSVPPAVRDVVELVSSELVTNAVEHAHSSSQLSLTRTQSAFRISVRDYGPPFIPRPRPIDINAPHGRGLHLVAALAQTWGTDPHPDGKTVWASLPLRYS